MISNLVVTITKKHQMTMMKNSAIKLCATVVCVASLGSLLGVSATSYDDLVSQAASNPTAATVLGLVNADHRVAARTELRRQPPAHSYVAPVVNDAAEHVPLHTGLRRKGGCGGQG